MALARVTFTVADTRYRIELQHRDSTDFPTKVVLHRKWPYAPMWNRLSYELTNTDNDHMEQKLRELLSGAVKQETGHDDSREQFTDLAQELTDEYDEIEDVEIET
jgi:hypothetical protein